MTCLHKNVEGVRHQQVIILNVLRSNRLDSAVSFIESANSVPTRAEQRLRCTDAAEIWFLRFSACFAPNLAQRGKVSTTAPNCVTPNLLFNQPHKKWMQAVGPKGQALDLNVATVQDSINFSRFGAKDLANFLNPSCRKTLSHTTVAQFCTDPGLRHSYSTNWINAQNDARENSTQAKNHADVQNAFQQEL